MGSKCKISFVAVLILSIISGCGNEKQNFYKDTMQGHDVWRLPIVKPYQLITTDCLSAEGCVGWSFQSREFFENFTVDSLNYHKNHLQIYNPYNDKNYVVIDIASKKVYKFSNRDNYEAFLTDKKINNKLYSVKTIHDSWKETGKLPWNDEIFEK